MTNYTHDLNIANADGATVRADINALAQALASDSASTSAPSTTLNCQRWNDTTNNLRKRRNLANTGWLVEGSLDESIVIPRSSNTMLGISDICKTVIATSTFTQTLDAAATLGDGWQIKYFNNGTGLITIDPNSSETINGSSTLTLYPGQSCIVCCNGIGFFAIDCGPPGEILLGSLTASSSSSLDFTSGIGTAFQRYRLDFNNLVPSSGTGPLILRLGDSGGFKSGASDYTWVFKVIGADNSEALGRSTASSSVQVSADVSASGLSGQIAFSLHPNSVIHVDYVSTCINSSGVLTRITGGGAYVGTGMTQTCAQLLMGSNITSGTAMLYGMRSN